MEYEYHKLKCNKCGKKILVEIHQFGISHIASTVVTCAKCIVFNKISDEFKKEHPDVINDLKKWIKEK